MDEILRRVPLEKSILPIWYSDATGILSVLQIFGQGLNCQSSFHFGRTRRMPRAFAGASTEGRSRPLSAPAVVGPVVHAGFGGLFFYIFRQGRAVHGPSRRTMASAARRECRSPDRPWKMSKKSIGIFCVSDSPAPLNTRLLRRHFVAKHRQAGQGLRCQAA
jgi:hypothetical protein